MSKKVIIIGAGPGGLSSGMLLASHGMDVTIIEKKDKIGGRNAFLEAGEYTFDLGPTFFLMKDVLEDIFSLCKRNLHNYVDLINLDPMYQLGLGNFSFFPSGDAQKMKDELERVFPGSSKDYDRYIAQEKKKYDRLIPCLEVPYGKTTDFFSKNLLKAIPYLDLHRSVYEVLDRYFKDDLLKICFTFQSKYIGMSPWMAPGLFSMISFVEHDGGIFHVRGGLNKLSQAMYSVFKEEGGKLKLSTSVQELVVENGIAKGVILENGEKISADYVIINSDFAYSMKKLVKHEDRSIYTDKKLDSMGYSCSTFMLYLGLDTVYENVNHHNIFFAKDYKKNLEEITSNSIISEDPSFYIHNPSLIDHSYAPKGKSAVYVLVPVGNTSKGLSWSDKKESFKEKILDLMESRAGMSNLRTHIEELRIITPDDWENKMDIYNGATFNLSHNLGQMLYFRPHNQFEEFKNCYLVGGGTHPGSGLPTIYQSGRISAKLILEAL